MRLPRDLDGRELAKALEVLGYTITRQTGSHLRVTTELDGQHHEVIPNHSPIKIGTLQSILRSVAMHHGLTVAQLLARLDL
ncbi:type II toxin-antitoxin system HicA family toxin [Calidifontimicrobium sp. SYSU G02091]|jgi:predicted RNA binding protein YcfA (HicA-like mRNA interferase family)|uniref:type II toxin-antitoxin system HicA family toxin n=1 Tax=Calidifontimicrobium sp. SYSU G02091 TaxID=2926421 RepID=UPI001F53632E|nr:type II toxin-antitoxin system HicA family toxin [Calidifontimicrobium sp. SYSU G02091]MCI1191755.1 type II toxin-antitoxin system HicA family toxin [Calidifontimicrobium sp. SYSU G02091]